MIKSAALRSIFGIPAKAGIHSIFIDIIAYNEGRTFNRNRIRHSANLSSCKK